jgi:hypothetical protein
MYYDNIDVLTILSKRVKQQMTDLALVVIIGQGGKNIRAMRP